MLLLVMKELISATPKMEKKREKQTIKKVTIDLSILYSNNKIFHRFVLFGQMKGSREKLDCSL